MRFRIKMLSFLGALGVCLGIMTAAAAQDAWPERAVKIISPYGAGGPNDLSARLVGEHLSSKLGQPFVVENKAGAGTALGNHYVASSPSDGYTILYAAAPYSTLEALTGKLSYDPRNDLKAVAMGATVPLFLIVNAESPYETVADLIEHAKSKTEGLTVGTPGHGSLPHLAMELLLRDAQTEGVVVHYKGDVAAYTDLVAGRLDATLTAITSALPHIKSGKLRVLGVASDKPSEIYPDAQPLKEQGLPNVVASGWYGFMVPASTPGHVIQRLESEISQSLNSEQIKQRLLDMGMEARPGSSNEFAQFIEAETAKWSDVIKGANITIN